MTPPTLTADVLPWAPGLDRGAVLTPVGLPDELARRGLRAALVTPEEPDRTGAAVSVSDDDGALRLAVRSASPVAAHLVVLVPTGDAVALWSPGSGASRDWLPPAWLAPRAVSAFDGVALGCLVGRRDRSLLAFGARGGADAVELHVGMVEETAELMVSVGGVLGGDALELLLDAGDQGFAPAVRAMGARLGLHRAPVGPRHEEPVLCTWYSLHQHVESSVLLREARLAAALGFGTVIVDDGWQSPDGGRGYGSTGDWQVERSKIPDPRALVDELAGLGLATMWWIGTPFVGARSRARAQGLPVLYDEPGMDAAVLDPRSRRVRRHLLDRLVALVASTGAAGLKLDFLERFARTPDGPAPDDAVSGSVPAAALGLLDDLLAALREVTADPLVEFREPYVGADVLARATMVRVGDCPLSPARNRQGVTDLRLLTSGVAVHADPVMWAPADTPERVAQHLHGALFGVPQVSVALEGLDPGHRAALAAWLDLWREHRDVLLHGDLDVSGVTEGYRTVEASRGGTAVTAQYGPAVSPVPPGVTRWVLVNAHDAPAVLVRSGRSVTAAVVVTDCLGRRVHEARVELGALTALPVPPGGAARLTFAAPVAGAGDEA